MTEATTYETIEQLRKLLRAQGCIIASTWCIDDVKQERPDLTDAQCIEVLERCEDKHDACIGINWDVIRAHADNLFPEARMP
jgi:hypothetical protein